MFFKVSGPILNMEQVKKVASSIEKHLVDKTSDAIPIVNAEVMSDKIGHPIMFDYPRNTPNCHIMIVVHYRKELNESDRSFTPILPSMEVEKDTNVFSWLKRHGLEEADDYENVGWLTLPRSRVEEEAVIAIPPEYYEKLMKRKEKQMEALRAEAESSQ